MNRLVLSTNGFVDECNKLNIVSFMVIMTFTMKSSISDLKSMPEGPRRIAAIANWFQGLYPSPERAPVLVGGAAVEIYTGGAYSTGDLDFVGRITPEVEDRLREAGFRPRARHWVHEEGGIFIELPGSMLGAGERVAEVKVDEWKVRLVSPEDALVDRRAAWKHWSSGIDGASAFRLWRAQEDDLEMDRLRKRATAEHVLDSLEELRAFDRRIGDREPTEGEVAEWARRER